MRPAEGIYSLMGVQFQSTHPRGVRPPLCSRRWSSKKFQSTHPRGVRHQLSLGTYAVEVFQSTHPRGVRRIIDAAYVAETEFQSTHPRGVRQKQREATLKTNEVSIHAPTRSATAWSNFDILVEGVFQSTHPRGVRLYIQQKAEYHNAKVVFLR